MSTYPPNLLPSIASLGEPACGDMSCQLDVCMGLESHGVKKPWYMTQQPVLDPKNIPPPAIVLMKMGAWVLEKHAEEDNESNLWQYCPSHQWKKALTIMEIRAGMCDACCETIPEEIVAAYTMHNWTMLQQYDSDMKKYGHDPYATHVDPPPIQVFR